MSENVSCPDFFVNIVNPDIYENALNPDISENDVNLDISDEESKTKMLQRGFMTCSLFNVLASVDLMQQKRINKGEKLDKKRITLADYQELVDNLKRFNNN